MQCKCGGETRPGTHEVKGIITAKDWAPKATEADLPLTIEQDNCICGRRRFRAFSKDRLLLNQLG